MLERRKWLLYAIHDFVRLDPVSGVSRRPGRHHQADGHLLVARARSRQGRRPGTAGEDPRSGGMARLQGGARQSQETAELEAVHACRCSCWAWSRPSSVTVCTASRTSFPCRRTCPASAGTVDKNDVINGGGKVPGIIAFLQAVSFATNTDWQSYEPEQMFTHFSQIVSTVLHFFFSSAVGIAAAAALVRGIARQQTRNIGNFWVDLTRITLYLFIPMCLVFALLNVWQGMPMNYRPYTQATTLDQSAAPSPTQPSVQPIVQGPIAAYAAPKVLGLNGPGITGADCAHPFENPTPLSRVPAVALVLFRGCRPALLLRPHDQPPLARLEHLADHVRDADCHEPDHLVFRGPAQSADDGAGRQSRPIATWKARKSASASTTRPRGPITSRSRPRGPTTASTTP